MAGRAQYVIQHRQGRKWRTDGVMTDQQAAITEATRAKQAYIQMGRTAPYFRVVRRSYNDRFGTIQEDVVWGVGQGEENTVDYARAESPTRSLAAGAELNRRRGGIDRGVAQAWMTLFRMVVVMAVALFLLWAVPAALELVVYYARQ